ncbi:uncharacterized protein VTP21DRAFT_6421 [Calcarisporiella thermophila]|uniref:uncharacterized protein n=1 Tax=Calcarisporiella thermophila TaxID=911321 RepID=UPI003743A45F
MENTRDPMYRDQKPPSTTVKSKIFSLAALLLWLTSLHIGGLFLFTRGFLLTRLELSNNSTCHHLPTGQPSPHGLLGEEACWSAPAYKKMVILLIDALRFDFVHNKAEGEAHYLGKLPIFESLRQENPNGAFLYEFVADPPTTTLQRLKALTTGTLPTFIDAGSNFAGTQIAEDNLIHQLRAQGKRVAFMGDDTWVKLFPHSFAENFTFPFDSFNVNDLHTVDNGVDKHLWPTMEENGEWDVLIGHFLGVDHCGHRYGPNHPEMAQKLTQMNVLIEKVVQRMDEDTLLVVMGDHGMDPKGDHGGDSDLEVRSALFMYSKKGSGEDYSRQEAEILRAAEAVVDLEMGESWSSYSGWFKDFRSIPQIDLVPTLSLLMGVPIPFNSLGAVIPEVIYRNMAGNPVEKLRGLIESVRLNSHQVYEYARAYAKQQPNAELAVRLGKRFEDLYKDAETQYMNIASKGKDEVQDELLRVFALYMKFLRVVLLECRKIWAQFDIPYMLAGASILVLSCACIGTYLLRWGKLSDANERTTRRLGVGAAVGAAIGGVACLIKLSGMEFSWLDGIVFGGSYGSIIAFLHAQASAGKMNWQWRIPSFDTALSLIFIVAHALFFTSNSFTVFEDRLVVGMLQTLGLVTIFRGLGAKNPSARWRMVGFALLWMVLVRISSTSTVCREEQLPYCEQTFYASSTSSISSELTLIVLTASAFLLPFALRMAENATRNYYGFAPLWIGWGLRGGLLLGAAYWILDAAGEDPWQVTLKNMLVRLAFGLGLVVGPSGWWTNPVCLDFEMFLQKADRAGSVNSGRKRGVKTQLQQQPQRTMLILGYANAFGSSYLLYLSIVYLIISLTQFPSGSVILAVGMCQLLCLLEISDAKGDAEVVPGPSEAKNTSKESEVEMQVRGPSLTVLEVTAMYLLAMHHFFATGHQATIPSLQWKSSFIGLSSLNFLFSTPLIVLNTLGSHVFFAVALPLLVLWKTSPINKQPFLHLLTKASLWYILYATVNTTSATIWAAYFRRHLMVWKVFAPRFMCGGFTLLAADVGLAVVGLALGVRKVLHDIGEVFSITYD